jgi:HSP20 family molecular chaperone IbpA
VIQIQVPGLKRDEIEIKIDTYSITVSTQPAQTEPAPERKYIICERPIRPLTRTFNFPFEIDKEKVKVTMNFGTLLISVPKPVPGKRKVPVEQAA